MNLFHASVLSKTNRFESLLHLVQCGCNVAHHGHEKERYLEDGMLKEVQSIYNAFVPSELAHVDEE